MRYLLRILILINILAVDAKEKCHVAITAAQGIRPVELVVSQSRRDPKESKIRTTLENGRFECDIETDEIELYDICDFGEVLQNGHTSKLKRFMIEDGALVNIYLDEKGMHLTSTGKEFNLWNSVDSLAKEKFKPELYALMAKGDSVTDEEEERFLNMCDNWKLDYCTDNTMLGFMLELGDRLEGFRYNDYSIGRMLDIYHEKYGNVYPNHSIHSRIALLETKGYQINGKRYNEFNIRNIDNEVVSIKPYFEGKYTVVVCWATWCPPCRKEAMDIIPIYEKYRNQGLNAFSIAREFESNEAFKAAVKDDRYPWPCFVDINDEFNVFEKHGATSSAIFLIDDSGVIIGSFLYPEELDKKLREIFG